MQVECGKMQEAIGQKFGLLLQPLGQFVSGLGVGFYYGWKLTLVILGFMPLIAFGGLLLARSAELEAKQTWYARAGAVAEEALFSMRTVAARGERREPRGTARCRRRRAAAKAHVAAFGWAWRWRSASYRRLHSRPVLQSGRRGDFTSGGDVILVFFAAIIGVSSLATARCSRRP